MANFSVRSAVIHGLSGGLAALVLFFLLNWVEVKVLENPLDARSGLLIGGIVLLVAAFGTAWYPVVGLITGLVMTVLVLIGWVISDPLDAWGRTATDLPGEALRHGAYMPLVLACAMALIGVGVGTMLHRRSTQNAQNLASPRVDTQSS